MPRRRPSPQALVAFTLAVCFTMAVIPSRYTKWATLFRDPVLALVAPVSGPAATLSGWLRPPARRDIDDAPPEDIARQRDFFRHQYYDALDRIDALERQIEALQSGVPYIGDAAVRLVHAPRIGADLAAGAILVRRGERSGIIVDNTVATSLQDPQHLVGIVTDAGPAISTIQLINDPRARVGDYAYIRARIIPDGPVTPEAFATAPTCDLQASGDGGFAAEPVSAESGVAVGDIVHLDDENWPVSAQWLILGRVTAVTPRENPLFVDVLVRPDFELGRVRHLILRTSVVDEEAAP